MTNSRRDPHDRSPHDAADDATLDATLRRVLSVRAARGEELSLGPDLAAARLEGRLRSAGGPAPALRVAILLGALAVALALPLIAGQLDRDPYAPPEQGARVGFQRPASIVAAFGSVWVAGPEVDEVGRIEPATGAIERIPLAAPVCGDLQAANTAIWAVHCGGVPFATRLDPSTLGTSRVAGVTSRNIGLANGLVVIPGDDGRSVLALDGATFDQRWRTDLGGEARTFAAAGETIWAIEEATGRVHQLDAATGRLLQTITVAPAASNGAGLRWATASVSKLWLVHEGDLRIHRVDVASGTVSQPIDVGLRAIEGPNATSDHQIEMLEGELWVRVDARTIARLNPATGQVVATMAGGLGGGGFSVTRDAIWIASFGADLVLGDGR